MPSKCRSFPQKRDVQRWDCRAIHMHAPVVVAVTNGLTAQLGGHLAYLQWLLG
jgi:hypothetical protein